MPASVTPGIGFLGLENQLHQAEDIWSARSTTCHTAIGRAPATGTTREDLVHGRSHRLVDFIRAPDHQETVGRFFWTIA